MRTVVGGVVLIYELPSATAAWGKCRTDDEEDRCSCYRSVADIVYFDQWAGRSEVDDCVYR